jgi:hypothetical protein
MLETDLRGVDSRGISLLPTYDREFNPAPGAADPGRAADDQAARSGVRTVLG